jgi:hypothetical protein
MTVGFALISSGIVGGNVGSVAMASGDFGDLFPLPRRSKSHLSPVTKTDTPPYSSAVKNGLFICTESMIFLSLSLHYLQYLITILARIPYANSKLPMLP